METHPMHGHLQNTMPTSGSEKNTSETDIDTFSYGNVSSGHIRYVQSHYRKREPTADFFMVSVSDGIHKSMAMPFYIIIRPSNDEIPLLHVRNITIIEGGICEIGPGTLNAEDMDIPPDTLNFTIIIPPANGLLLNGTYGRNISFYKQLSPTVLHRELQIHSFTLDELNQGLRLLYMHDDTDTVQDSFTVQLADGKHTVQDTLHVHIMSVNDEVPRLIRNGGLELEVAENKVLSSVVLEVEDKDSPRNSIYYVINNVPVFGELKLKVASAWTTLYPGMNFTQEDVDMNRIWYFHTIILGCKGHDSFRFYVTDGGNISPPESFYISVLNLEKGDIVLLTRPVTLTQGDRVTLVTDVLVATDGTGKPGKLLYAISVPPVHGQIEYINYPGVPISSFSQLDVAAQKVCYVHDNSHEASKDSFSFTVSNGLKAKDGFMEFTIEPKDQVPPTLRNNKGIQISEGGTMVISSNILQITDPDSPLEKLRYTIIEYPQHGQLYLNGRIMEQNYFSQVDVNNLYLSYRHYGGGAQLDRFSFTATDDANNGFLVDGQVKEAAVAFLIQVEHLDKLPPKISFKDTPTTVDNTRDGRSSIQITSRNLKASDPDSEDEELIYVLVRTPSFGHLENANTGDYVGRTFTQKEVNQRLIRYIINPSFEVTSDSFEFRLVDPAGNTLLPETLDLKWSVIELAEPVYHVCEDVGTLAVKLVRTGSSKDPAFVGINVQEVSARIGLDFTHSSASLVQFDPGVSTKLWNIYVKNDGLEENHESFKVFLRKPKNAILGKNKEAAVNIMDSRRGHCSSMRGPTTKDLIIVSEIISKPSNQRTGSENRMGHQSKSPMGKATQTLLPNRVMQPHRSDLPSARSSITGDRPPQPTGQQLQLIGKNVLYHGMNNGKSSVWLVPDIPIPLTSRYDHPQGHEANSDYPPTGETEQVKTAVACPPGWTRHTKFCYRLNHLQNATWEDAERSCNHMFDSHLTSVNSDTEMRWLWKFAEKKPFWIGMTTFEERPGWLWSNGRSVTFNHLKATDAPPAETSERKCVLVWRRKEWMERSCYSGQKERYICSLPLQKGQ